MANDPSWLGYSGARQITSVSTSSAGASVSISSDGRAVQYTPPDDPYSGDQFVYIVDSRYPSRVTITIPTTLTSDRLEIIQNTQDNVLSVLANDPFWPNYAGSQRITHVNDVADGASATIAADGKTIQYTPAPNASGWQSFKYVVDGFYEARVDLLVQRPVQNDYFAVDRNSSHFRLEVLENDTFFDLTYTVRRDIIERVTSVSATDQGGTVELTEDGRAVWRPPCI